MKDILANLLDGRDVPAMLGEPFQYRRMVADMPTQLRGRVRVVELTTLDENRLRLDGLLKLGTSGGPAALGKFC